MTNKWAGTSKLKVIEIEISDEMMDIEIDGNSLHEDAIGAIEIIWEFNDRRVLSAIRDALYHQVFS